MRWVRWVWLVAWMAAVAVGGCGGDARVDLSAADGIRATAKQMEIVLQEYHDEVARYDTSREDEVIAAFVGRIKTDVQDDSAVASHVTDFRGALEKIRKDRDTEYTRRAAAADNVAVLREMARGLERLGIESLTLQDEMKRYLTSWIDARRRADSSGTATTSGTTGGS